MRTIELVARVTPDSAQALWYELESGFDGTGSKAITVDASAVHHFSAAALQVLLVARKRAVRDGGSLHVVAPSLAFADCVRVMGAQDLIDGGAA